MFSKKHSKYYDRENYTPILRSSICTGEKTAGFINNHTGHFYDIMLINSEKDLKYFLKTYSVDKTDLKTEYWFICDKKSKK